MAVATFRFYEELNDFLPPSQRKRDIPLAFEPPVPVRHLIETLGVPHTEVELILVDGHSVGLEQRLEGDERISVYPQFETLDVTPLLRIRDRPLRDTRFIADAHLGKLARYLRLLGFDTLYRNDMGDDQLVRCAENERRILLTRDRSLLMRRDLSRGCYVRQQPLRAQIANLLRRLDLYRSIRPFTRCMCCNGRLHEVPKEEVMALLPAGARMAFDTFWRCESCGRVYWKGSHYDRLKAFVSSLS